MSKSMKVRKILEEASLIAAPDHLLFESTVCVKTLDLDGLRFEQWWIDKRNKGWSADIVRAVLDTTMRDRSLTKEIWDVLTFARLHPARTNCANRLALGANLRKKAHTDAIMALQDRISVSPEISAAELDNTAMMLVRRHEPEPDLELEAGAKFLLLRRELLAGAYDDIRDRQYGLLSVVKTWASWQRKARRRGESPAEASAVDYCSLAARVSFQQIYDAFWNRLLDGLSQYSYWPQHFIDFHRLWHSALALPPTKTGGDPIYVLNGDCLALHPIGNLLIRTKAGRSIIRRYLESNPGIRLPSSVDNPATRQFYAAVAFAITVYDDHHVLQRETRRAG